MIRVIIADDHPLMRDALLACFEDDDEISVVAEVNNGQAAIRAGTTLDYDVLILDLYLPDMDGMDVLKEVLSVRPQARVLIFTSSMDEARVSQGIETGALGYMIKDAPRAEILKAVREVSAGRSYLSVTAAGKLASLLRQRRSTEETSMIEPLTEREKEILDLVRAGASNIDIAHRLHIGETTVRTHISHLLRKMGLKNRSELMMHLLQEKQAKSL